MKVLVRGPALTRTGYGEHCRFVLRALRKMENIDLYLIPVNWGNSNWIWEHDEERLWLDDIVHKTTQHLQQKGEFDMSIQVTIPNEWQTMAPINIGVTAGIETTKVAPVWLEKANQMHKVITISEHSKKVFIDSAYDGVDKNSGKAMHLKLRDNLAVDVVHYPVKTFEEVNLDLNLSTKFNFLTVAQWGPRKNLKNTIRWFVEEFIDNPDAGLIVKTYAKGGSVIDKVKMYKKLKKVLRKYDHMQCKVYLLHGDMTDQEMHSLYGHKDVHCLVSLTHGEGFGLPLFEAAYCGMPVLATNWSGHLDFLQKPTKDKKGKEKIKPHFAKVEYELKPVQPSARWEGVIQKDSNWAFPEQGSYKMRLREVYKDYGRFKSQAKKLQTWVTKTFTETKQHEAFNSCLKEYVFEQVSDEELDDIFAQM